MTCEDHDHLLAERNTLQRILADIPDDDEIDRISFLSRLKNVEQRIAASNGPDQAAETDTEARI